MIFLQIQDPTASKPEDWDENEPPQIPDITATKPEGWLDDADELIPDRTSKKPQDWYEFNNYPVSFTLH